MDEIKGKCIGKISRRDWMRMHRASHLSLILIDFGCSLGANAMEAIDSIDSMDKINRFSETGWT